MKSSQVLAQQKAEAALDELNDQVRLVTHAALLAVCEHAEARGRP